MLRAGPPIRVGEIIRVGVQDARQHLPRVASDDQQLLPYSVGAQGFPRRCQRLRAFQFEHANERAPSDRAASVLLGVALSLHAI